MPTDYVKEIELRLDTNVLFYDKKTESYEIVDMFAVKGGQPIAMDFGSWDLETGFTLQKRMSRWERRIDLKGSLTDDRWHIADGKFFRIMQKADRVRAQQTCVKQIVDMSDMTNCR